MSFAAPLFLLGLAGLLLPWLLHRLNEQNAPVQDFPSERFLEETRSVSSRQKRLRYLKLLALRALLLIVLCFLFANPLVKKLQQILGDTEQLHVLVVDQSFSMRHGNRWQEALGQINDVVDSIPAQMPVQLLTAMQSLSVVTDPALDRSVVTTAAASLQPGFGRVEFGPLIRSLGNFAEKNELPVVVHLITDAQASAMPVRLNDLISQQLVELTVYSVGSADAGNVSISAHIKPTDSEQFAVVATINSVGSAANNTESVVSLQRGDELVEQREVIVPGNGSVMVTLDTLEYPPERRLVNYEISVSPTDELPDDNVAVLPVRSEPPAIIQILSDSRKSVAKDSNELLYTSTALELDRRNETVAATLASTLASTLGNTMATADAVIYLHAEPVANGILPVLPSVLQEYLTQGGQVLYVVNTINYDNANSVQDAAPPGVVTVARVDENHPLNLNSDEWSYVSFYSHQKLDVPDDANVIVSATDGYPVLMEIAQGDGRMLILNAPLNGIDNDLPISALFVPFMHSIVDYFLRIDAYPSRLTIGDSVKLPKSVQILSPAGNPLLDLAQTTDGSAHVVTEPGVYTLLDQRGEHSVVVTTDPAESDTSVATDEQLSAWQTRQSALGATPDADTGVADSATAEQSAMQESANVAPTGMSLTSWLLPLFALLLLAETIYANWYLRIRRTA